MMLPSSSRFTHAEEPDDSTNPLTAVARSSTNHGLASADQRAAAASGAYGVMTRQQTSWRPHALLCRRFNVPEIGGERSVCHIPEESVSCL